MSIWTDLLFLHGHVATPTGLASLPAPAAPRSAPTIRPTTPPSPPRSVPPLATVIHHCPPQASAPLPRANRISPNDLW